MEIRQAILEAFGYVYMYRGVLGRSLAKPFVLLAILNSIEPEHIDSVLTYMVLVCSLAVHTVFAITTHRVILIGPDAVPRWGIYKFTKRELSFAFHVVGLGVLIGLLMIPLSLILLIPVIGFVIVIPLICYVFGRLSLVFPAIATDNPLSFTESWDATKGHEILMLFIAAIFPILVGVPEIMLSYIPHTAILVGIISAFTTVFVVSALSVAFKIIRKIPNAN